MLGGAVLGAVLNAVVVEDAGFGVLVEVLVVGGVGSGALSRDEVVVDVLEGPSTLAPRRMRKPALAVSEAVRQDSRTPSAALWAVKATSSTGTFSLPRVAVAET